SLSWLVPELHTFRVVRFIPVLALATSVAACVISDVNNPIRDVSLQGNHAFSDGDIIDHLATQPPQGWLFRTPLEFDRVGLQLDRRSVEAFYRERGYFSAQVTDVNVQHPQNTSGVKVTFTVVEGQPTRVASIDVRGPRAPADESTVQRSLRSRDTLRKGDIFDHPAYLLGREYLLRALQKRGYAHAQANGVTEMHRHPHTPTVSYAIQPA